MPKRTSLAVSCLGIRLVFVSTVALLAAMLGDALVEGISNAQILWHGQYTDRSSLDLFPTFLLGATAAALTLGLLIRQQARETGFSSRTLLLATARSLAPGEIARLLPAVYALQILIVFCMETVEQFVVYGHTFGGTLWLGGPVAASLCLHGLLAIACAFLIAGALRALTAALVRVVAIVLTLFVAPARSRAAFAFRLAPVSARLQLLPATAAGKRGPPVLPLIR